MLIAVAAGLKDIQGCVMAIFTLPYLLFAAPAGWLADRFSKRHVLICAKVLELIAMLGGAVAICVGNWPFILAIVFAMGLQSAIFSPSLNGSIPELYPPRYVPMANAILKAVVTMAILAGVASSGLALDYRAIDFGHLPPERLVVAIVIVAVSALGVLCCLCVPRRKAASPRAAFPWSGPLETLRELNRIEKDRLLAVIIKADMYAWFAGAVLVQIINVLAVVQFGLSKSMASYLVASELIGITVGGILVSRVASRRGWYRVLPAAALLMGVLMAAAGLAVYLPEASQLPALFVLLGLIGVGGGVFLIPCEAFIQIRPAPEKRGAVIAAANFMVFSGILLSGLAANALTELLTATNCLAALGGLTLLVGIWLRTALPKRDAA